MVSICLWTKYKKIVKLIIAVNEVSGNGLHKIIYFLDHLNFVNGIYIYIE